MIVLPWDSDAPWNQHDEELPDIPVEVRVTVTLSKTVQIKVSDYEVTNEELDEDGYLCRDISFANTDFLNAVKEQVIMPQDASLYIDIGSNPKAAKDLSDWEVEDIDCYQE